MDLFPITEPMLETIFLFNFPALCVPVALKGEAPNASIIGAHCLGIINGHHSAITLKPGHISTFRIATREEWNQNPILGANTQDINGIFVREKFYKQLCGASKDG